MPYAPRVPFYSTRFTALVANNKVLQDIHMPCKHSSSSGHTLTVVQGEQVLLLITPPFPGSLTNDFFMSTLLLEPSSTRDDLATTRIIPSLPHTLRSSSSTSASVPFSTGMAFSLTSNAAGSYAWPNVSNSTKANKTLSSEWLPGCMLSVVGAQWSAKHIFDGWFSAAREQPPGNYHPYYAKLCCGPKK